MPAYRVEFRPQARKDLADLPKDAQRRMLEKIDALAADPRGRATEKLKGGEDRYRIRHACWRAIFTIDDGVLLVLVIKIRHRREVYER